jgi:hypothetical protein
MASRSSADHRERSVPLGKYWRSRPLVFSFVGSSRFVVNDPAVAGIHATVFAALVSRIRIR